MCQFRFPYFEFSLTRRLYTKGLLAIVVLTIGSTNLIAQSSVQQKPSDQLQPEPADSTSPRTPARRQPFVSDLHAPLNPLVRVTTGRRIELTSGPKRTTSGIQQVSYEAEVAVQTPEVKDAAEPAAAAAAAAVPPAAVDLPPVATSAVVESQIKKVEKSSVADSVKAVATKHHQQSIEFLKLADDAAQKTVQLKAEIDNAPAAIEEARKRLAQSAERPPAVILPTASASDLEALRLADEERLLEARKAYDAWEAKARLRTERKPQMAALIEKTTKQLLDSREAVPAVDAAEQVVIDARKIEHESLIRLLETQVTLYQVERSRYDALSELFPLQRDLALRTRSQLEKRSEFWKTQILEAGKRDSVRQAAEAQQALQDAHPALRDLATRNAKLTEQRSTLQTFLKQTSQSLNSVRKLAEDTDAEFVDDRNKESQVGLTTAIGILLRNHRSHLPVESDYRQKRRDAEASMARLRIEQMPLHDEDRKFTDPIEQAEQLVAELDPGRTTSDSQIQTMALALFTDRQKYLDDILKDYDKGIKDLAELDMWCSSLIDTTVEFRNYIDARVLWIPSAGVVNVQTPQQALRGVKEIAADVDTARIGTVLAAAAKNPVSLLIIGLVAMLLTMQRRFRNWINTLSQSASQSGPEFAATAGALGLTLVIASVWPGVIWLIGRQLTKIPGDNSLHACGAALKTTAIVFWSIELFRQMCRSNGIAELHLMWPVATVRSLHSRLVGLMAAGLPFVFAVQFVETWKEGIWSESLGRMLFVAGMCVLAFNLRRIVHPQGSVFRSVLERNSSGWMFRTRYVWSAIIIGSPLALACLSIAGFHYTAEQLLVRVEATAWLCIALMMAFGLLVNRMNAAKRNLLMNQQRQLRAEAAAAREEPDGSSEVMPDVNAEQTDFRVVSRQALKLTQVAVCVLFAVGTWMVWAEVLPALQVFDRVELWSTMTEVAEEVEVADGVTKSILVSRTSPVTLGSFFLACGVLGLFVVAGRNIPGLLELSVLEHLPMDNGGRNAITTLCRYALLTTGLILSAKIVGIGWSSVQWLLAALTVGLGFGLQEIFANFVSGLIILFERPVRIGDVVTIDNVSGKVSRIQIRATTITDFDRKEYIVPNKEFVTGRVLNWTLSDKTNRIKIDVGVAYGDDTALARALLMQIAKDNPKVMADPEPNATFEGFGDSCLMLSLRCFIPGLDIRLQVITELHEVIHHEFKTNGLEIAFPQRDIHIRTTGPNPLTPPAAIAIPDTIDQTVVDEHRKAA